MKLDRGTKEESTIQFDFQQLFQRRTNVEKLDRGITEDEIARANCRLIKFEEDHLF
jgi:hypothetical protein